LRTLLHLAGGVEVVSADTSFSDPEADDNRGVAVSTVLIVGTPHHNQLQIAGTLRDGATHQGVFPAVGACCESDRKGDAEPPPLGLGVVDGDRLLGTADANGWWYKTRLVAGTHGASYRQTRGAGRVWETRDVPFAHV
jgi:hypothetical protein